MKQFKLKILGIFLNILIDFLALERRTQKVKDLNSDNYSIYLYTLFVSNNVKTAEPIRRHFLNLSTHMTPEKVYEPTEKNVDIYHF